MIRIIVLFRGNKLESKHADCIKVHVYVKRKGKNNLDNFFLVFLVDWEKFS